MVYRRGSNLNPADTKISCVFNNVIQNYLCFTKKCIFFDFSKSHTYLTMIASLVAQVGRLPLGRTRNLVGGDFINLQVVGENPCPPKETPDMGTEAVKKHANTNYKFFVLHELGNKMQLGVCGHYEPLSRFIRWPGYKILKLV